MLISLHIKNYALIENLNIEFTKGLNILTGETGAGKSIIIESIGLILGERTSLQAVRKGSNRCFVTAEFDISHLKELKKHIEASGLNDTDSDSLIIRREIDIKGKSRAFINDCPVTLATLISVGNFLVDVHGQHEHQTLIKNTSQRLLIDRYAHLEELTGKVSEKYVLYKEILDQINSHSLSEAEKQRMTDLYSFQINEIDSANLSPTLEEEVEHALPQLKNSEKLRDISSEAYQILYGNDGSVLDKLNKVQAIFENINNICNALPETADNFSNALYQIEECSKEISDFLNSIEDDPQKLSDMLEKQNTIYKLKKKYGQTINDILAYKEKISQELNLISRNEETNTFLH